MQPIQSSLSDINSKESKTAFQRQAAEQIRKATDLRTTRRPANSPPTSEDGRSPYSTAPAFKRLKTSHTAGRSDQSAEMSARMAFTGQPPKVIDLTGRPSNFQPHTGAKRLVIKNLRTTSQKDVEDYYNKVWRELDDALTAIFKKNKPSSPLEVLCRGVEATCRRGQAERLSSHIKSRCKSYLEKELLPHIEAGAGPTGVHSLREVHKYWVLWNEQSTTLRSLFSYLDRSYLLNHKDHLRLEDLGIFQFRHAVFQKGKSLDGNSLGSSVISGICELVKYSRSGDRDLFDPKLLKDSLSMLHIIGIYGKSFEPNFLSFSEEFFYQFARKHSSSTMETYIKSVDDLLDKEALRCHMFNFDSTTKKNLLDNAHEILIEQQYEILSNPDGLANLVESNNLPSLRALYALLSLSKITDRLRRPWENYIIDTGSAIVLNKEKSSEMVLRMLELKKSLELIIRDSFQKDVAFTYSLREAFGTFMNGGKNIRTDISKVGEYVAKYMDSLLRGGLKAVPRSLIFDAIDRDAAEKRGEASAGDEDAELDRQLDQALELFRFIQGKDVFEAFYKKDLARRLLLARSASQDAERNMIAKLKSECGSVFTFNLEQMFKDKDLGRETMNAYKEKSGDARKTSLDLDVDVLTSAAWPPYQDVDVIIPADVMKHLERFKTYYLGTYSGRRLHWRHQLDHAVIRARFQRGTKELFMSGFQAIVLLLFNDLAEDGYLSYQDIQAATKLPVAELQRTLQSLACAKVRVLNKHPKGRDVNLTDTFTVNMGFADPRVKIKINQIQLKETKEEVDETHEKVKEDRRYETQAAIVRIMKSRKKMTHSNLVAEAIDQTKHRGFVEVAEIKRHIQILTDKEYLERDEEDENTYNYLA